MSLTGGVEYGSLYPKLIEGRDPMKTFFAKLALAFVAAAALSGCVTVQDVYQDKFCEPVLGPADPKVVAQYEAFAGVDKDGNPVRNGDQAITGLSVYRPPSGFTAEYARVDHSSTVVGQVVNNALIKDHCDSDRRAKRAEADVYRKGVEAGRAQAATYGDAYAAPIWGGAGGFAELAVPRAPVIFGSTSTQVYTGPTYVPVPGAKCIDNGIDSIKVAPDWDRGFHYPIRC
jgi:hypothetical protein